MMLVMHDAFRRDLAHLARAASRHRTGDPARRAAIRAGWELSKTALVFHHTGEDTDLWPRMRAHLADRPGDLALLHAMEDEHARIDPLLDTVGRALAGPAMSSCQTPPTCLSPPCRRILPMRNAGRCRC